MMFHQDAKRIVLVITALPTATAAAAMFDFKDGQVEIRHQGITRRVRVDDAARFSDPARPLLTFAQP